MKLKIFAALCFAMVACSANAASKGAILLAEDAVRDMAKDPDSTKFKKTALSKKCDGSQYVTGFVNAKNGYGGYSGFKFFHAKVTGNNVKVLQAYGILFATNEEENQAVKCEGNM